MRVTTATRTMIRTTARNTATLLSAFRLRSKTFVIQAKFHFIGAFGEALNDSNSGAMKVAMYDSVSFAKGQGWTDWTRQPVASYYYECMDDSDTTWCYMFHV